MNIEAEILKEIYIDTIKELHDSPVYKVTVLDLNADVVVRLTDEVKASVAKDVGKFIIGGNLENFRTQYGHIIKDNVTRLAQTRRENTIHSCERDAKEIKKENWHEEIFKYIHLMVQSEVIEARLLTFGFKPIIETDDKAVTFIYINKQ